MARDIITARRDKESISKAIMLINFVSASISPMMEIEMRCAAVNFNGDNPIYLQVAKEIEDNIMKGIFEEETRIPSTTEMSKIMKITPATAGKGMNILVNDGILYKKRGSGMFVAHGAMQKITGKHKESFFRDYVLKLVEEARKLDISKQEIFAMIKRAI